MAELSQVELNNVTYDLKDSIARQTIPFGVTDNTSIATAYTATVPNVTELRSGTIIMLMNTKVTSAANCTLNINGLGAKPMYMPNEAAKRVTTQFAVNYTWMLVYNETRVSGGCWDLVYLYNSNTTYASFNNLSLGSAGYLADSVVYSYQLLFQMDDLTVTPLNNVSNATGTGKTMLTNVEFDPFGDIFWYATTTTVNADARINGAYMFWNAGALDLRYTFNCGQTLIAHAPVYLKVSLQSNGKVKIANSTPWTQTLPTIADGYYYIYLGRTYSNCLMTLEKDHPIYYHDGTSIRQYTKETARLETVINTLTDTFVDALHNHTKSFEGFDFKTVSGSVVTFDTRNLD